MEACNLIKNNIIPNEELDRVFRDSYSASAEMDASFLCFEDEYEYVLANTKPSDIIIDLGCAYNPQCWYFKDYDRYIAVDLPIFDDVRFDSGNVEFYIMSIQKFIKEELPKLNLNLNNVVAICNAVPDEEARKMVVETFPRYFVAYPGMCVKTNIGDGVVKRQNVDPEVSKLQELYEHNGEVYGTLQEDCECDVEL